MGSEAMTLATWSANFGTHAAPAPGKTASNIAGKADGAAPEGITTGGGDAGGEPSAAEVGRWSRQEPIPHGHGSVTH